MTTTDQTTTPARGTKHSHGLSKVDAALAALGKRVDDLGARILVLETPPIVVPPPVEPPPVEPPPVNGITPPPSIDRTGATDVSGALGSWLMALPSGAVADLAAGTYLVNGTVHLANRSPLTVTNGTIRQTTRSTTRILLVDGGGSGIVLRRLGIIGANPRPGKWDSAYEHNHAVQVGGVQGIELDEVSVLNVGGDGVYLSGGANKWAADVRVHGSMFDGIGRMGIAFTDGVSGALIQGNVFQRIGYYLFDIEPNGAQVGGRLAGAEHVKILDNSIGPKPYGDYPADPTQADGIAFCITGASGGGFVDDIEVARNVITDASYPNFRVGIFAPASNINVHDNPRQVTSW